MASLSAKRIAYITSMATGGLAGFNHRELKELQVFGAQIFLFVTKYMDGPYMAPKGIPTFKSNPFLTLTSQPGLMVKKPSAYFKMAAEAAMAGTLADFMIACKWADIMKNKNVDWIHCHWGDHKFYIGYYCHRILDIPLSVTLHGYDLYANPNWKMLEKGLEASTRIITISENNRRLISQKYPKIAEKIEVIRLSADLIEEPDKFKETINVLIVGGFHFRKGYDTLLKALKRLDRNDIHLWVVGYKGPVDVRKIVKEFGLEKRVTIFGQISDEVLKLLYTYCDIFTMPSKFGPDGVGEGLPVSLMEAMAYEKPIVSTYHTGIPELVPDILVKEDDDVGLAEGIAKLADNPELRLTMGKRNRKIIQNGYSSANVKKLLEAFSR